MSASHPRFVSLFASFPLTGSRGSFRALAVLLLALWSVSALQVDAAAQSAVAPNFGSATTVVPGYIYTVAGNGMQGFSGDGGPATSAMLSDPLGVAVDSHGNLYIADSANFRVRKVAPDGTISTVAGTGTYGNSGDGGPATSAQLSGPTGVATDSHDNLYIADNSNVVRLVTAAGVISTVAGGGPRGGLGDGGPATSATLSGPRGIVVDKSGDLYIADGLNQRVRKVTPGGTISTVAGNGSFGFAGDGGPATSAQLYSPEGVALDGSGNLLVADSGNGRIRKVTLNGVISTVAGGSTTTIPGDGGPATSAFIANPVAVIADNLGNFYIADNGNSEVRKVDVNGIITNVAGGNGTSVGPDGVPATSSGLSPYGFAFDNQGNLLISDVQQRVRELAIQSTLVATTTTLTSSASMIPSGASETLTATITYTGGTSVPTGTVTFLDGTTTLGTGTPNATGVATFTTSTLSIGTHLLTAQYGGDTTYGASTSQAISVVVTAVTAAPTTLSLTGPANGTVGQASAFVLQLTGPGTGTPTGNIVISSSVNGGPPTPVQTIPASTAFAKGGTAVSFTPTVAGTTTLTVTYGGDSNFGSSSISLSFPVAAAPAGSFSAVLTDTNQHILTAAYVDDTFDLTITSIGGFNQPLTLSASGVPSGVQLRFLDASGQPITTVTPAAGGTVTVHPAFTLLQSGSLEYPGLPKMRPNAHFVGERNVALCGGLFSLFAGAFFLPFARRKRVVPFVLLALVGIAMSGLTGCSSAPNPVATVTITVSAPPGSSAAAIPITLQLHY